MSDAERCDEAERMWTTCLDAGIVYRDSEKMELISLIRRDSQFRRFEDDIEFARLHYTNAKSALDDHLAHHGCWKAIQQVPTRISRATLVSGETDSSAHREDIVSEVHGLGRNSL